MTLGFALVTALALPRMADRAPLASSGGRSVLSLGARTPASPSRGTGRDPAFFQAVGARRLGAPVGGDALGRRARRMLRRRLGRGARVSRERLRGLLAGSRGSLVALARRPGVCLELLRLPAAPRSLARPATGSLLILKIGLAGLALAWGAFHHSRGASRAWTVPTVPTGLRSRTLLGRDEPWRAAILLARRVPRRLEAADGVGGLGGCRPVPCSSAAAPVPRRCRRRSVP